jgi:hypothetical protein
MTVLEIDPSQLKVNPAYASLNPPSTAEEDEALLLSIKENGQIEPVIINEKFEIIPGHRRRVACIKLSTKIKCSIGKFKDTFAEKRAVIEDNVAGRTLNNFQRAEMAVKLYEIELEERRFRAANAVHDEKSRSPASIDARETLISQPKAAALVARESDYHLQHLKEHFT